MRPMQFAAELAASTRAVIPCGVLTTGLKTTLTGIRAAALRRVDDLAGIGLDLPQRLWAIEVLAAGDEPDFEGRKIDHGRFSQNGFVCSEG